MGSSVIPPLPSGFQMDATPAAGGGLPPLPPGFTLDAAVAAKPRQLIRIAGQLMTIGPDGRPEIATGADADAANNSTLKDAAIVGGTMALPMMGGGGVLAGAARLAASPVGAGATAGALDYAQKRDPLSAAKAAIEFGLLARLAPAGGALLEPLLAKAGVMKPLLKRIAESAVGRAAAAEAPAVAGAAETPMAQLAAKYVAEGAAPAAAKVAPAASGGISLLRSLPRAAQEMVPAVESAAVPVAEAAVPEAAAAESELAQQLRESIRQAQARSAGAVAKTSPQAVASAANAGARMPMKATPAVAMQVEQKVLTLRRAQGLSRPQIAATLKELYGQSKAEATKMVDMILETYGVK